MICPDCKGSGEITLFTSVEPCQKCVGCGKVMDGPEMKAVVDEAIQYVVTVDLPVAPGSDIRPGDAVGVDAKGRAVPLIPWREWDELSASERAAVHQRFPHGDDFDLDKFRLVDGVWQSYDTEHSKSWDFARFARPTQAAADQIRSDSEVVLPKYLADSAHDPPAMSITRVMTRDESGSKERYVPIELARAAVKANGPVLYYDGPENFSGPWSGYNLAGRGRCLGAIWSLYLDHAEWSPERRSDEELKSGMTRGQQVAAEVVSVTDYGRPVFAFGGRTELAGNVGGNIGPLRRLIAELIDRERAEAVEQYKRENAPKTEGAAITMNMDMKLAHEKQIHEAIKQTRDALLGLVAMGGPIMPQPSGRCPSCGRSL